MRTIAIALAASVAYAAAAAAQPSCGDPPRVDDQTLKGELDGRAQALQTFRQGWNIATRLSRQSPDNPAYRNDLQWVEAQIAEQQRF